MGFVRTSRVYEITFHDTRDVLYKSGYRSRINVQKIVGRILSPYRPPDNQDTLLVCIFVDHECNSRPRVYNSSCRLYRFRDILSNNEQVG